MFGISHSSQNFESVSEMKSFISKFAVEDPIYTVKLDKDFRNGFKNSFESPDFCALLLVWDHEHFSQGLYGVDIFFVCQDKGFKFLQIDILHWSEFINILICHFRKSEIHHCSCIVFNNVFIGLNLLFAHWRRTRGGNRCSLGQGFAFDHCWLLFHSERGTLLFDGDIAVGGAFGLRSLKSFLFNENVVVGLVALDSFVNLVFEVSHSGA